MRAFLLKGGGPLLGYAALPKDIRHIPGGDGRRLRITALLMLPKPVIQPLTDRLRDLRLYCSSKESESAASKASRCSAQDMGGSVWNKASITS